MKYWLSLFVLLILVGSVFALGSTTQKTTTSFGGQRVGLVPVEVPITIDSIQASSDSIIQDYDAQTRTATITDASSEPLASVTLLTPVHLQVGAGYQKVAEMQIDSQTDYENFFNSIYTFDLKNNNNVVSRDFDVKELIQVPTSEPVYDNICQKWDNNGTYCKNVQTGNQIVNVPTYIPFDESTTWTGTKTISLWTDVQTGDHIEWIPDLFGTTITQWATWDYNANIGIISDWNFNETSGLIAYDQVSGYNGTNTNSVTINETGILGKAVGGFKTNKYFALGYQASLTLGSNTPYSICSWVKPMSTMSNNEIYSQGKGTTGYNEWGLAIGYGGANKLDFYSNVSSSCGTDATAETTYTIGNWYFICGTYSGNGTDVNGLKFYVNGVHQNTDKTFCGGAGHHSPTGNAQIGNSSTLNIGFDGNIDETTIWNRVLSPNDITNLYNAGVGLTYPFPLTQTAQARIMFNVYKAGTSTHLTGITFDSNVNSLDLSGQNSPFSTIYKDINTSADGNFSATGYDSNYQSNLYFDSNKTIDIYLNRHVSMSHIYVYDENTATDLTGASVDYNGTPQVLVGNVFNFNTILFYPATYTFTISKTGYGTRYYQVLIDGSTDLNINFMLLPSSLGTPLIYKLYNSTGDTALPNTYFEMRRPDKNNWSIGRLLTNATANVTMFTNVFDQNYSEIVGDVNTYLMVNLSVLYPKNEDTLAQITNYWKITISGALSTLYQNLNATKNIYIIPNLITPYNLQIKDMNTDYFARNYAESFAGNPLTATLQPYLISTSSGVQTNIKSLNPSTLKVVPTINIKIYKQLLGTKTLVEEVVTSDTGDASTTLTSNQTYYFDVYQNGVFLSEQTITGPTLSGTTIYIYVGGSGFTPPVNPASFLNVGCYPGNSKLNKFDTNLAQIILLNNFGAGVAIQNILIYVTNHGSNGFDNNIYSKLITTSSNYTNSITVDPNNFTLDGNVLQKYDSNGSMTIYITVTTNTGTSQYTCQVSPYSGFNIQTNFGYNLRPFFGCPLTNDPLVPCPTLLIAALFVSLTISVLLSMSMGYASMNTIGFMFIFIMGIFTYITWVPYILFGIMLAGTIGLILAEVGRQRL